MRYRKITNEDMDNERLLSIVHDHQYDMTGEKLHEKFDIAWQLALRDLRIEELEAKLDQYKGVREDLVRDVMNLPKSEAFLVLCDTPSEKYAYSTGHRDARHSSCDLINEAFFEAEK